MKKKVTFRACFFVNLNSLHVFWAIWFLVTKKVFSYQKRHFLINHQNFLFWLWNVVVMVSFFGVLSFSHSLFFLYKPWFSLLLLPNLNFSVCRARFADSFDIIVHGRFEKMTYIRAWFADSFDIMVHGGFENMTYISFENMSYIRWTCQNLSSGSLTESQNENKANKPVWECHHGSWCVHELVCAWVYKCVHLNAHVHEHLSMCINVIRMCV